MTCLNIIGPLSMKKSHDFGYTLDDVAQEWYGDIVVPTHWNAMWTFFHRYFSIQGRSVKDVHEKWRDFKFDSHTDDIVFITNAKQTVH